MVTLPFYIVPMQSRSMEDALRKRDIPTAWWIVFLERKDVLCYFYD
jgi:hypothetical protein